ncbi:MAG: bifunctional biotin--[acetyl-CoA-carboxylase] ligase/biotin operon repressor BirA [Cellvibrionaceae bacterium]
MDIISATQQSLIELLADGECHSGEEVGKRLGVSRTAIWKQLQKLSDFGLKVVSHRGQGYRLARKIDLLEQRLIFSNLPEEVKASVDELEVLFAVDSSNNYALKKSPSIQEGKAYVCFTEFQSHGRGRRGRQWVSPLGCNLYSSFLWQFDEGATVLEGLSLAIGVAVVKAIEHLGVQGLSLKWPNDILLNGEKLGGILLEMSGDPSGVCQVVIGIGINVGMPKGQDIDQSWSALGQDISRVRLASSLVAQIVPLLRVYATNGFSPYMEDWHALDAFSGRCVSVISGSQKTSGIACGVESNGALLLEVDGLKRSFYGGELSLRLGDEE